MRRVTIQAPFTDGLVTDIPAHQLGPRMASAAVNMLIVDGVAQRRLGHHQYARLNGMASPIRGVRRVRFALANREADLVVTKDGGWADDGVAEFRWLGSTTSSTNLIDYDVLPRCVYNDEVIICDQAGERGIRRYAGAGWNDGSNNSFAYEFRQFAATNKATVAMNTTAGSREFSYTLPGTNDGNIVDLATLTKSQPGWYVNWGGVAGPRFGSKIANVYSTSKGTLLSAVSVGGWPWPWFATGTRVSMTGTAYPAVSVYSAGSVTTASSGTVATGVGTEWVNGDWGKVLPDAAANNDSDIPAMLYINGGQAYHRFIGSVSSDTSMIVAAVPDITTPMQYHITRGLPFADACVHRGSLCGAGVRQYPNRVYIAPPGWDLESPPGSVPPLRLEAASFQNPDPNYFLLDFIDVPSTVDTDPVVAVLPSNGPLLVIKGRSLYGIYGDWPNFTQSLIAGGVGCVDRRSAISTEYGQFWAGPEGIYRFMPQTGAVDITAGRINNTWRRLAAMKGTSNFVCAMGAANGKLVVGVGNEFHQYTLVHSLDTGAWDGFQGMPMPVALEAVENGGDPDGLLAAAHANTPVSGGGTGDRGKYLRDYGPMLAGRGTPIDHGETRPPTMTATTSAGLARHEGIDGMSRMLDVALSGVCEGRVSGTSTYTKLSAVPAISGGVDDASWTAGGVCELSEEPGTDAVRRRRGRVGVNGRLHAVTVKAESSAAADSPLDSVVKSDGETYSPYRSKVHQLTVSFRDSRGRA